jgi:YesN/AraC family two-component response regulator
MTNSSDIESPLDKITGWVKHQGEKQQKRKVPWNWVTGLIVGAVALLAVGFMYWRSWKQGRELAKLKHERDVTEQEKAQAKVSEAMAVNQRRALKHKMEAERLKIYIETINEDLGKITNETTETNKKIDSLKNWRDVDRYLDDADSGPGAT